MSEPLVVTSLLSKKAEVEAQIVSLGDRLAEARADLVHVVAVVRLFDPALIDRPATAYHGVTRALKRSEVFAHCRTALLGSPEPLDTRELARHVITAEGWDTDDKRLRLTVAVKVGGALARMALRGAVSKAGTRDGVALWVLADSVAGRKARADHA